MATKRSVHLEGAAGRDDLRQRERRVERKVPVSARPVTFSGPAPVLRQHHDVPVVLGVAWHWG